MKTNINNKLNANNTYKDRHTASPTVPHPGIRKSNSRVSHGSKDEHRELLNKVKQMNRYTKDIEECLEEAMEDDMDNDYRYRRDYEDDDNMRNSRYSYRRGRM